MLIPYDFLIPYYMVYNMREYGIVSLLYIYLIYRKKILVPNWPYTWGTCEFLALGTDRSVSWYSCLESPTDTGTWQPTVNRVAKSQTRLKWLGIPTIHTCSLTCDHLPEKNWEGGGMDGWRVSCNLLSCFFVVCFFYPVQNQIANPRQSISAYPTCPKPLNSDIGFEIWK